VALDRHQGFPLLHCRHQRASLWSSSKPTATPTAMSAAEPKIPRPPGITRGLP